MTTSAGPGPAAGSTEFGELDEQSDLGGLARLVGRVLAVPQAAAWVGCALLVGAAAAVLDGANGWWAVAASVLVVVVVGAGLRPRLSGPVAWAVPSTLFAVEVAVVALLQQAADPGDWDGAFVLIVAGAYRRYDLIYRRRDLGAAVPAWTRWATLGVEGRLLLTAVAYALAPDDLTAVLLVAGAVIGAVVLVESTLAWVRWLRQVPTG